MILLSIQGLFRTVLIIIGVVVVMRFIGKLMMTKRAIHEHQQNQKDMHKQDEMIADAKKNFGKTTLTRKKSTNLDDGDFTPYEEV